MKAYILKGPGSVDNLELKETEQPQINENEVLVKVKAIAINPVDVKSRGYQGTYSWLFQDRENVILGWDLSGEVVAAGPGQDKFKTGDEVFGMINFPAEGKVYAEYVAVPASQLALKPENISFEEAAGATLAALTALQAFKAGNVKEGDKVLIHGASGGVGHYAVQLAKTFGAYVTGTSSAANKEFVLGLGADEHVDYKNQRFEDFADDFDFVLNSLNDDTLSRSLTVVKEGGAIVSILHNNLPDESIKLAEDKKIKLDEILVSPSGEDIAVIAELLSSGKLKTHIHQSFKFEELKDAHLCLEQGNVRGKVVISV